MFPAGQAERTNKAVYMLLPRLLYILIVVESIAHSLLVKIFLHEIHIIRVNINVNTFYSVISKSILSNKLSMFHKCLFSMRSVQYNLKRNMTGVITFRLVHFSV